MKTSLMSAISLLFWLAPSVLMVGQAAPPQPTPEQRPVSYASVSQLNNILNQIEQTAKSAQVDLARLRIDKWKTDSNSKRQALSNALALSRNLKTALPEVITQLRNSPEDLAATFKLYRNLDALYDVLGSVVESSGAFGSKDEYKSLAVDMDTFEKARRDLAERTEKLAVNKEVELSQLRAELKAAQAAVPPKKVVVEDTQPPPEKKPVKKKAAPKAKQPNNQPPPQAPQNPQTPQ